jgi:nucleoside-diphosphate-sugar epimerase
MLKHLRQIPAAPDRAVLIGANGFIGRVFAARMNASGVGVLGFGSSDIDLTQLDSADRLAGHLRPDDAVVMLSALTPDRGRDVDTFLKNLMVARNVCKAIEAAPVAHVVYVSSDAVYPFCAEPVDESASAAPADLYGMMHRAREVMFSQMAKAPLAILRCSSVYGGEDSHNSYGPNRFRRHAFEQGSITLGGRGEETRDHIYVGDVAELMRLTLFHRSEGVLNLATGRSESFMDVARMVAAGFDPRPDIKTSARTMPITHRRFYCRATKLAFPDFRPVALEEGIRMAHQEEFAVNKNASAAKAG